MDKAIMGLVAAFGAAVPLASAHAAIMTADDANNALHASSVAELLEPASNAVAVLTALDEQNQSASGTAEKGVQLAQWHHHHHHHHHFWHHHHHHHHHWRWCRFHPMAPQCL